MTIDTLLIDPNPRPESTLQATQFSDFSAFLAWVGAHWHDTCALQHAQWLISPFVAIGQRRPADAHVWRQARWRLPENPASLASCSVQTSALRWLDAAGASRLLQAVPAEQELHLDGLTELDVATATVLATHKGALDLSGLRTLTPALADALAGHIGLLRLDGCRLDASATELFARGWLVPLVRRRAERGSPQPGLSLGGVTTLDAPLAELLCQVQGELHLNGLDHLTPQQAQWLAQRQGDADKALGPLHLDRWQSPDAQALKALAAYAGPLSLGAWGPPDTGADAQWQALAAAKRDGLLLAGITALSANNAKALAQLPIKRLSLPGILQLSPVLIECLGSKPLQRLALDGVRSASAEQIRRLVELQNADTSGLSMASLELTPELRAELKDHRRLFEPLKSRVRGRA